jgi:CRISPR/Cas system-associated endonuclease Cas1
MKEFNQNGITLVFYQKPEDEKFSFLIKDNEELTTKLLLNVSNHRVKEKDIKYAVKGIFEKIEQNLLITKNQNQMNNPIVELAEKCQRIFRESMVTRVTGKTGADHNPTITVEIELPNGKIYKASGINQKIAKQEAAEKALAEL